MNDQMLDHGLEPPTLGTDMGYFQVVFQGPGDNIERLWVPEKRLLITPSEEARLNERQKAMVAVLVRGEALTSRRCEEEFHVTCDTTNRGFVLLKKLGLAVKEGKGRSTRYVLSVKT